MRITKRQLVAFAKRLGATVEDDSAGRWNVLQLVSPEGMLWQEDIRCIKVQWPVGESSEPACRDAYSRLSACANSPFRPMTQEEKELYAED